MIIEEIRLMDEIRKFTGEDDRMAWRWLNQAAVAKRDVERILFRMLWWRKRENA